MADRTIELAARVVVQGMPYCEHVAASCAHDEGPTCSEMCRTYVGYRLGGLKVSMDAEGQVYLYDRRGTCICENIPARGLEEGPAEHAIHRILGMLLLGPHLNHGPVRKDPL